MRSCFSSHAKASPTNVGTAANISARFPPLPNGSAAHHGTLLTKRTRRVSLQGRRLSENSSGSPVVALESSYVRTAKRCRESLVRDELRCPIFLKKALPVAITSWATRHRKALPSAAGIKQTKHSARRATCGGPVAHQAGPRGFCRARGVNGNGRTPPSARTRDRACDTSRWGGGHAPLG